MTTREFLTAISTASVSDELKEFALAEIAKLDARNDKRRNTLTKEQKANEDIKALIVKAVANGAHLANQIAPTCEISTQKASALCRLLVESGELRVTDLKVKGKGVAKFYSIAE